MPLKNPNQHTDESKELHKLLARLPIVDRYRLLPRLQVLSGFGFLLIVAYALRFWNSGDVLRIAGVGILVAAAALVSGFVLGFIFCIPRMRNENPAAADTAAPVEGGQDDAEDPSSTVIPNSNLVEISDWLTKIIVGVGLVELKSIPHKLGELSYYLGLGLQPTQCGGRAPCADFTDGGQAFGLSILVFYFTVGFLWGYVWTRLYFYRDLEKEKLQREKRAAEREKKVAERGKEMADKILTAEALLKERKFDEATKTLDEVLDNNPDDGRAVLTMARVLKRQAMEQGVTEEDRRRLLNQALEWSDRAIALLPHKAEPLYNKACYQALLGLDKNEILANLRAAASLNPGIKRIAAEDEDLGTLRQDHDFQAFIIES